MTTPAVQIARLNFPAPSFQLDSSSGSVRLDQYRGRPVVVFFMREFSCVMCQGHVREMKQLSAEHPEAQFLVVGGGSLTQARQLAARFKLSFPVIADPERQAYARYDLGKAMGLMQRSGSAVIDRSGVLRTFIGSFNPMSSFSNREIGRALQEIG